MGMHAGRFVWDLAGAGLDARVTAGLETGAADDGLSMMIPGRPAELLPNHSIMARSQC
jgi:hypothetical protein